jgi:ABC-2 type transport system ATP-binding protein
MMTGFISSTSGTIRINGYDILDEPLKAKQQLGYLPDTPPIYGDMTVAEYLNFVCDLKKVRRDKRKAMIDEILTIVGIKEVYNRLCKNLSKGYKQRVGLAQALVGFPEVLILDEPTVGLDPKQIIEIRRVIKRLGEKHTVILSSHILSEVSAVCDRVMIINNGKIVATDTTEGLSSKASGSVQLVTVKGNAQLACEKLNEDSNILGVRIEADNEDGTFDIVVSGREGFDIRENISYVLAQAGVPVLMLRPKTLSLEDAFIKVINGEIDERDIHSESEDAQPSESEASLNMTLMSVGGEECSDAQEETEAEEQ